MKGKGGSEEPTFTVLNPEGLPPEIKIHALSPRLDTLAGKTVSVINLHGGNEIVMESIARDLKAAVPDCNVIYLKTDGGFTGSPLTEEDWAKMLDCDAAVLGHTFCGGAASEMGRVAAHMELKGVPVVLETWDFKSVSDVSKQTFIRAGVPAVREVFTTPRPDIESLTEFIPQFIDALTRPLTEEEKKSGHHKPPAPPRIAMTGTYADVQEYFQGDLSAFVDTAPHCKWTDGLPITPPTEEAVAEMLTGTSHAPDEVVAPGFCFPNMILPPLPGMRPSGRTATVEKVAINAVMAGCKPAYMPVALAMAEAGGCVGSQADCSWGHIFIVSGPIAKEIGMNSEGQFLCPGNPANTSLGRAASLIGLNLAGAEPGVGNMERCGTTIWGTTFAENENSPWEGLNVLEGFDTKESVLVMPITTKLLPCCFGDLAHPETAGGRDQRPKGGGAQVPTLDSLIATLKHCVTEKGVFVVFTPECAHIFAEREGFNTAKELQDYLWENVNRTRGEWGAEYSFYTTGNIAKQNPRGSRMLNPDHLDLPEEAPVPRFMSAKNVKIMVAGGEGSGWVWGGFLEYFTTSIDKWR